MKKEGKNESGRKHHLSSFSISRACSFCCEGKHVCWLEFLNIKTIMRKVFQMIAIFIQMYLWKTGFLKLRSQSP